MVQHIGYLTGAVLDGRNGIIGQIAGFYFDDRDWIVRYALVQTDVPGRHVFVPTRFLQPEKERSGVVQADLAPEQVKASPVITAAAAVPRRDELKVIQYYELPVYWRLTERPEADGHGTEGIDPPVLRSVRELIGYPVQARDGAAGKLDDLLVEDISWSIAYAVIAGMADQPPERSVLIPLGWLDRVDWAARTVHLALARETVQQSPVWDASAPVTRVLEERVTRYYARSSSPHHLTK